MAGSSKKRNNRGLGKAPDSQDKLLPASLPLLISRPEARTLLQDVIDGGKALLLKRAPSDLREDTPRARDLKAALKTWGTEAVAAMTTCFGEAGATTVKSISLSYTTLEKAKQRLRLRLDILKAALKHTNQSQKARSTTASRKPRSTKRPQVGKSVTDTPSTSTLPEKLEHNYDFCLSFAGEDRKHAKSLSRLLTQEGARVFYDRAEEHDLWGKDLYAHLQDVYQNRSRYCVMFTSAHYVQKAWTNLEREAAQARSLTQLEYILPIKLDDTPVPGLLVTKGIMDIREKTLKEIAQVALKKLREAHPQLEHLKQPKTKTSSKRVRPPSQRSGSSLVMLGDHFYRVLKYREAGDIITVNLLPRGDAEALRLRELTHHAYNSTTRFAYRHDSGRRRIQDVEYIEEGNRKQVVVTLQREPIYTSSMALGSDSAERLERQLKWVVFGDAPPHNERYFLSNGGTTPVEDLNAPVLKKLWGEWKGTKVEFLKAAQLLLMYLIKEFGILDQPTTVDIGPWEKQKLAVYVKGSRKTAFSTSKVEVAVSGTLEFPTKSHRIKR